MSDRDAKRDDTVLGNRVDTVARSSLAIFFFKC